MGILQEMFGNGKEVSNFEADYREELKRTNRKRYDEIEQERRNETESGLYNRIVHFFQKSKEDDFFTARAKPFQNKHDHYSIK